MLDLPQNVILEITDADFDLHTTPQNKDDYHMRKAARGVLVHDGKIALLSVTKKGYHKLPGGGIEEGEDPMKAFIREIKEETGCECKIREDYPSTYSIIEWRDAWKLCQVSYIFFSEVVGEPQEVDFTDSEKEEGFVLEWVPFDQIEKILNSDEPLEYEGKFIQKRDRAIVEFYKEYLK